MRSKKGVDFGWLAKALIALAAMFIIITILYYGFGRTAEASMPMCNSRVAKCACFYNTGTCPSAYVKKVYDSEMCPNDDELCDDESYGGLLSEATQEAREHSDNAGDYYGTCCMAPIEEISPTRLRSYNPEVVDTSSKEEQSKSAKAPTMTIPDEPAVITIDFDGTPPVNYKYDRSLNTWQYNGGAGWGNVNEMGMPYHRDNIRLALVLEEMDELEGYAHFRTIVGPNVESVNGIPELT